MLFGTVLFGNGKIGYILRWVQLFRIVRRNMCTIYSLSSGHGKCAVAVVRISGSLSGTVLSKMTSYKNQLVPRKAILCTVTDPETKEQLDKGLVLWFPGPNSYTGEDSCELHLHGSNAVLSSVFIALQKLNLRPASAGEFTQRAFYNGKLDLTEVEGLCDLIQADTEVQRKQAFLQLQGSVSSLYHSWRSNVVELLANIESYIEFDEDGIVPDSVKNVKHGVAKIKRSIEDYLLHADKGKRLKNGIQIAIIGAPNVGKSSLLNTLCKRPVAIVTAIPGTTRDTIEAAIDIGGYPVHFVDTAGIRQETSDIVEQQGISRAHSNASAADIVLLVVDVSHYISLRRYFINTKLDFSNYLRFYANKLQICTQIQSTQILLVINKCDLLEEDAEELLELADNVVVISCVTGFGINELFKKLSGILSDLCGSPSYTNPLCSQSRHEYYLKQCVSSLGSCLEILLEDNEGTLVFAAEHLRNAARHIGTITGAITTEEMMNNIFSQLCVGK